MITLPHPREKYCPFCSTKYTRRPTENTQLAYSVSKNRLLTRSFEKANSEKFWTRIRVKLVRNYKFLSRNSPQENQSVGIIFYRCALVCSRNSSVGIATSYGLDGTGFLSVNGQDTFFFSQAFTQDMGPTVPPVQRVPEFFPRSKAARD